MPQPFTRGFKDVRISNIIWAQLAVACLLTEDNTAHYEPRWK